MSEELKGDSGERVYNWDDIKRDMQDDMPREDDFLDCYTEEEIRADKDKIREIKRKLGIQDTGEIPDSRVQEYATAQDISEMDWFGEEKRNGELFPEDKGHTVAVLLSSEYDDFINHTDAICMIDNADTNFLPLTFALDMTYNTDGDSLDKKMSWRHPSKQLGIPGLATVKYFEDRETFGDKPLIEKGRIEVMPRFVVGFSPELSTEITELRMTSDGWGTLKRESLSAQAKWCVLKELKVQSRQMLEYLEKHKDGSELLGSAYTQVASLDKYFAGAIKAAREMEKDHPEWERYANRDSVVNEILARRIIG